LFKVQSLSIIGLWEDTIAFYHLQKSGFRRMHNIKSKIDRFLRREIREIAEPINKGGIEARPVHSDGFGGHVSAEDFKEGKRPEVFTPSTVIISGGYGEWDIEIPGDIRRSLIDVTLRIETIRTHGMLHSPLPNKYASILVNNQLVDKIHLVKLHPHGKDYGVDSRRPFPILRYIDRDRNTQTVRVEVDKDAFWDIDRVTLEPVVLRKEIKPEVAMVVGAIISAIIGAVVGFLMS